MRGFLFDLATELVAKHPALDDVTIVFPNRRAILYFRHHLTSLLKKPAFPPELVTIEEFIARFSSRQVPDKLELIKKLYKVYATQMQQTSPPELQSFSDFFFWGEMLVRDFEEIDKYLVNDSQLFLDLSNQKEIDSIFEFLSEEQVSFLKEFWGDFETNPSANKERFLKVWKELRGIYQAFKAQLSAGNYAYEGMLHREVAEALERSEAIADLSLYRNRKIVFAGFNALTLAEEKIISFFVEECRADVYWDVDAYYLNSHVQEAGTFFREYQQHPVLGKTFSSQPPASIQQKINTKLPLHLVGAPQSMGQVKALAQVIEEQSSKGLNAEETLIVLPDERLLIPTLHSLPASMQKINVTMGFSLASTPLFSFVDLLFELQLSFNDGHFYHKPVLAFLQHPYATMLDADKSNKIRKHVISQNWVDVPLQYCENETEPFNNIFQQVAASGFVQYLQQAIVLVGETKAADSMDKEYAFQFYTFLNRLQGVMLEFQHSDAEGEKKSKAVSSGDTEKGSVGIGIPKNDKKQLRSLRKLVHQLAKLEKIPFAGEPLEGLQIMGVLETRNLDFKNVFVLSLNEGVLPSGTSKGSYIPYNVRKAYGLPTVAQQDAMYAYLFYRVWQRAENIFLFYNSETDTLGQGEMSRYVQQLVYESGLTIKRYTIHADIRPKRSDPIVVNKDSSIMQRLARLSEGNGRSKGMAPSVLNTYLECRLKFYLRYVAGIKEAKEVEDEMDNRVLGNLFHQVIERFYKDIQQYKKSSLIETGDLGQHQKNIDTIIDEVFRDEYGLDKAKPVVYTGQRIVVREIVKRLSLKIISLDRSYAPFQLEALEQEGLLCAIKVDHEPHTVFVGGIIDRVDRKENVIRVVDYKTGKDELAFKDIESLFERGTKRNKAAFQTLIYAMLYAERLGNNATVLLKPGLINRKNLFSENFAFGLRMNGEVLQDALPLLPEFKDRLREMLNEMFDSHAVFDQTTDLESCRYCEFKSICYR